MINPEQSAPDYETRDDVRRHIPPVNELVEMVISSRFNTQLGRETVVKVVRTVLDEFRQTLPTEADGTIVRDSEINEILISRIQDRLTEESAPPLRAVINATGIILHTGLGRAPLAASAVAALAEVAGGYAPVEIDMRLGKRGKRSTIVRSLLCELTGAESATVVNNNAAGVMLALAAVATGGEVIVSRGELVEIGGSFRVPSVIEAGGAIMREVGTTNKTRLTDYENTINEQTAALLKVHPSNFCIEGFTQEVAVDELAALGRAHDLPVIHDIGSGLLRSGTVFGLSDDEPNARESIRRGADLVLFSGDKLLGGPQAGIIVGKRDLVERIERHPMMRAMRVGKLTLTALGCTLQLHRDYDRAVTEIPVLRMATEPAEQVRKRAKRLLTLLTNYLPDTVTCQIETSEVFIGGGSVPGQGIESYAVVVRCSGASIEVQAESLRNGSVAVLGRIREDRLWFDMRTVFEEQIEVLASSISAGFAL